MNIQSKEYIASGPLPKHLTFYLGTVICIGIEMTAATYIVTSVNYRMSDLIVSGTAPLFNVLIGYLERY